MLLSGLNNLKKSTRLLILLKKSFKFWIYLAIIILDIILLSSAIFIDKKENAG